MHAFRSIVLGLVLCAAATGQVSTPENPVYVDDSTNASDVLARLDELKRQGSVSEAVRALQRLLETEGNRVLATADADLYRPVRRIAHERMLSDPELLGAYRAAEEAEAARQLEAGAFEAVVQSRFLTASGLEAALRVAQLQLERAAFRASLITLEEIEIHPDFETVRPDAVALLTRLSAYLDPVPGALLARWGAPEAGARIIPPPWAAPDVLGPADPGPPTRLDGIIPRPLTSADLSPLLDAPTSGEELPFATERRTSDESVFAWTLPTVVDDVVYTNDGEHISSLDRFTLRLNWRVQRVDPVEDSLLTRRDIRRRQSRRIEDSSEVTIAGDRLLAVTGLPVSGTRQGDARLHCMDRATGRVFWSVDPADLDPALEGGSIRGPAVAAEGVAVVAVRKWARERRTVSIYLVGLDLDSGGLRWFRLMGSAGALPFQTAGRFPERITLHEGIVYRGDEIGLVAAVEMDTGRPVWVRRFGSVRLYDTDVRPPWASSGPVVRGGDVITIAPNRERIIALDQATGELRGALDADRFAKPNYLLSTAERLVCVSAGRIAWTDLATFPDGDVRVSDDLASPPMVGRVAATGEELIIPRNGMITTLDLATRQARSRDIDEPGNLIALDGQLLAADESQLHSYMVWEVASRLLQERLAADPSNPAPAATLAELAFRAGRYDQILAPVDRALDAIRRSPTAHELTRRDLFVSVLGMLDPATLNSRGGDEATQVKIADMTLLAALTERLEALAESPEELVSHHLIHASLREAMGDVPDAIESLQRILGDRFLAGSFWHGGQLTIRADLEASRRISRLLSEHKWDAYADFEREAQVQFSILGPEASVDELGELARRYPFSSLAPQFWLSSARADDSPAGGRRLLEGVRSLERLHGLGAPITPEVAGELFGLAIQSLVADGRAAEAGRLVDLRARDFADIPLTIAGIETAPDDLLGSESRLAEAPKRPRIGLSIDPGAVPRLEQGRVLTPTMNDARPLPTGMVLLASPSGRLIRLLALDGDGVLRERWRRVVPAEPILLELTETSALVAWLDLDEIRIESIDAADGSTKWEKQPFEPLGLRDGVPRASLLSGFTTPLEGRVFSNQLLLAGDDRILAIAERSGRVVTVDRRSGRELWRDQSEVERVFDITLGAGVLVVAGTAPDATDTWKTRIVTQEARTGEVMSRLDDAPGMVRWLRVTNDHQLAVGLDRGVICLDLAESQVRWMLSDEPTVQSIDAWALDDTLFVLDQSLRLWRIDVPSGRLIRPDLETRARLGNRTGIQVRSIDGLIAFASASGMVVYDESGDLIGIDVFDSIGALVPSEHGRDMMAMIDTAPVPSPDGFGSYMLYLMANDSGRLLGQFPVRTHAAPESVTLLDGKVLISAGEATLVIDAPAED